MEERFKFRFWDKQTKLMVDCAKCSMIELPKVFNDDNRFIKMQSTGLKDKNGKLIYEGDILHINNFNCNVFVIWNKDLAGFELKKCWCTYESVNIQYGFNDREIIGNIYKNKDLLEEN